MATTSSTRTSSDAHKHADLEKEIAALHAEVAALTKRLSAAEAKSAVTASAPSGDFVTKREWGILLKKLGSYIGFRL